MADVTIRATKNGPYIVEGPIELFDTEGNKITVDKSRIALCRCGASSNNRSATARLVRLDFRQLRPSNPASAE